MQVHEGCATTGLQRASTRGTVDVGSAGRRRERETSVGERTNWNEHGVVLVEVRVCGALVEVGTDWEVGGRWGGMEHGRMRRGPCDEDHDARWPTRTGVRRCTLHSLARLVLRTT